jgi:23S rRNA pseudouridine2605 synthase
MVEHRQEQPRAGGQGQGDGDAERVAKVLARSGVASRRAVERLIAEGRVALNGRVLDTPAVKVEPGDIVTVDGKPVDAPEPTRLWRYHKPSGLVTTHDDPQGRPTVFKALPEGMPRVISVGRLDLNSEGLLLLTNDGALARSLELPANAWVRRYRARAFGRIDQAKLDTLKNGIVVEGVSYGAIEARIDKAQDKVGQGGANVWISVALKEGKNREVRRVLQALGLKVNRLIRIAYGPFALNTLAIGEVEEVGPRVIREQLAEFVAPENLPKGDATPRPLKQAVKSGAARRAGGGAARSAGPLAPEPKPKPTYKAGWAKPKPKAKPGPGRPKRSIKGPPKPGKP